jgi:hypothetical protein
MIPLDVPSTNVTRSIAEHFQLYEQPLKDSTLRNSICSNNSMISSRSSSVSSVNLSSLSLASTPSREPFHKNDDRNVCATPTSCADRNSIRLSPKPSSLVVISRKRAFENLSALALDDFQPNDEGSNILEPSVKTTKAFFPSCDGADDNGWGYYVDTPDF